jgi:hypothetical protein
MTLYNIFPKKKIYSQQSIILNRRKILVPRVTATDLTVTWFKTSYEPIKIFYRSEPNNILGRKKQICDMLIIYLSQFLAYVFCTMPYTKGMFSLSGFCNNIPKYIIYNTSFIRKTCKFDMLILTNEQAQKTSQYISNKYLCRYYTLVNLCGKGCKTEELKLLNILHHVLPI